MNGKIELNVAIFPWINITAKAVQRIVIVLPAKLTLASNGTAKSATFSRTFICLVLCNVTGIVAAEDCVPKAVKYAGDIVLSICNGFCRLIVPVVKKIKRKYNNCKIIINKNNIKNILIYFLHIISSVYLSVI